MRADARGDGSNGLDGHSVGGVEVEADLVIDVNAGPGAQTTAHLSGSGREVRLRALRPEVLVAAAGRRANVVLTELAATSGVRAEFHGPRRRLAVLDADRYSRIAALTTGNPHLYIDPAGWAVLTRAAAMSSTWRALGRPTPMALAGGGGAAAVVALMLHRHRRHSVPRGGGHG